MPALQLRGLMPILFIALFSEIVANWAQKFKHCAITSARIEAKNIGGGTEMQLQILRFALDDSG
jgi:hypothetical protein